MALRIGLPILIAKIGEFVAIPILHGEVTDEGAKTYAGEGVFNPKSKIQNREWVLLSWWREP